MRWALPLILVAAALAGCTIQDDGGEPALPSSACPRLPDNSTLDCGAYDVAAIDLAEQPPTLSEGWACSIDHDDEAPAEVYELWSHRDGQVGWRWHLEAMPEGAVGFAHLALYGPALVHSALVPFQTEAFYAYPEAVDADPLGGDANAYLAFLGFRLDLFENGTWRPADFELIVDTFEDSPYFVVNVTEPGYERVIDSMVEDRRPMRPAYHAKDRILDLEGGGKLSLDVFRRTIDFGGQYFGYARGASSTDCDQDVML